MRRAYLCAKCKKLYDTVLQYEEHLDSCDGAELSDAEADAATDKNDPMGDGESAPTYEHLSTVVGGDTNAADLLNAVIKTEEDLMLILDDDDALMMQHAEYLDE